MQLLTDLAQLINWLQQQQVKNINDDSRLLQPGDAFLAYPGDRVDGRQFVPSALQQQAVCVLEAEAAQPWLQQLSPQQLTKVVLVRDLKTQVSAIAAQWLGNPSQQLEVFAITGTNGKTSSSWWLSQALNYCQAQQQSTAAVACGLIGTLGVGSIDQLTDTGLTTPSALQIQHVMRQFVDADYSCCALEASSIGIEQHRLDALQIKVAAFTNCTQDHLDFHLDMPTYWAAKKKLFQWPQLQAAVVNADDSYGQELLQELADSALDVWSYALEQPARLRATDLAYSSTGLSFVIREGDSAISLTTPFIGAFNVSNLLGVVAMLRAAGISLALAVEACGHLSAVPGRMQSVSLPQQPLVVVDYAHTPDALIKALVALQPMVQQREGKLYCLIGCGGNRDAGKRPLMAAAAEQHADVTILTSDNPRFESPQLILDQMLVGISDQTAVQVQVDRAKAIADAVQAAAAADVILIAGKGHEDYQDIAGTKQHFSDVEQAQQALQQRLAKGERC